MEEHLIVIESIENKILDMRGKKVMLDRDLAEFYGIETKRLNEAVRRNVGKFPKDFMFQLNEKELENWRSQFATSNSVKMGLRYAPFAFTRRGILMLSSVINSDRANRMNITIMRVFDSLEIYLATHHELEAKLKELETKVNKIDNIEYKVNTQNEVIKDIIEQIRRMVTPASKHKGRIGFYKEDNSNLPKSKRIH